MDDWYCQLTQNCEWRIVDQGSSSTEHETVGQVENIDVGVVGGGQGQTQGADQGSWHGCHPQPHLVCQDARDEGQEECWSNGQRSNQGTLEGSIFVTFCLQIFFQFDKQNSKSVDYAEHYSIDNKRADHY